MGKKIAPKDRPLTKKQKAFVEWYMQNGWNATEAAKQAGYKGNRSQLSVIGHQNLAKLNIQKVIDKRFEQMGMGANEVIAHLTVMARGFDVTQYATTIETYTKGKDGKVYPSGFAIDIDMKRLQKDGFSHLVKRIYATKTGSIQVEMHDRKHALELIGKHRKLFTDKLLLEGSLDLTGISDDGAIAAAKAIINSRKKDSSKGN